jgi:cobalt-zinc-cadmium efflux system outer membrane protein
MRSFSLPFRVAVLALLPLLAPLQTHAASAPPLTLNAAIQLAFQHNPELRSAAGAVGVADALRLQAGAAPNPELSVLSEGLRNGDRTVTVQLNQALELGGKRRLRITAAEREQALEVAALDGQRATLRATVASAFFDVLAAQERLQLATASLQLSQSALDAAARRVTAGKVSPLEQTRARVALAGSKIELSQANSELTLAQRKLAATWGAHDAGSVSTLVPPEAAAAPHASLDELLSHLPTAPALRQAQRDIERQQALANVERSKRLPDLTLSIGSKRDQDAGRTQAVIGLSVPLPLFDRNQGNLLAALRKTEQARDSLAAAESRIALELTEAFLRFEAARAELDVLRQEVLPGAQSAFDAASTGFSLGKFAYLDVLDAQRTLFQSKAQYLRALAESHRASAAMERLIGTGQAHPAMAIPAEPFQDF